MIVQLSLLIFLLIITGIGPGMLMTRRMRLAPLERLCTALGLSWITIYLLATAIYLSGISWHWAYVGSLIALVMFLATLPDTKRMLANHAVRRALIGLALLFIWMLLLLALVRNYSGGKWSGDWFEHYDRTQLFLHHGDIYTRFIDLYLLPARPPMMNLLTAFFLAQVGKGYPAFELCFSLLNLSAFLPAALMLNQLRHRGARALPLLVIALASSPFFAENITYSWTKLFSAFYLVLAIALYLRNRRMLAFVMLTAACLVHYSALPFAMFITGHYLWTFRKRRDWRELFTIFFLCLALLSSWFAWSIQRYGLHVTLATNTSVTDAAKMSLPENIAKVGKNIADSIVPPLGSRIDPRWRDQMTLGFLRDISFIWYQQNVLLMLGSAGAFVALWIVWRMIRNQPNPIHLQNNHRWFWLGMLLFCIPVGIATVGEYEPLGLAHAVLQPFAMIGIAAVAAYARHFPRWVLKYLLLGWAIDFCLGILLQFYIEHQTFTLLPGPDGAIYWVTQMKLVLIASENFNFKQMYNLKYIGDYCADYTPLIFVLLIAAEFAALITLSVTAMAHSPNGSRRANARKLS